MANRSESHKKNTQQKLPCRCVHCAVCHVYRCTLGMLAELGDFSAAFRLTALVVIKLVL